LQSLGVDHYGGPVPDRKFPRPLIRKLESEQRFPLTALEGIRETRSYLDQLEEDALCDSRDLGASISEIAEIMQMTRQSVYNKLKSIAERKARSDREAQEAAVMPEFEEKKQQHG
jgi:hypothetical protein